MARNHTKVNGSRPPLTRAELPPIEWLLSPTGVWHQRFAGHVKPLCRSAFDIQEKRERLSPAEKEHDKFCSWCQRSIGQRIRRCRSAQDMPRLSATQWQSISRETYWALYHMGAPDWVLYASATHSELGIHETRWGSEERELLSIRKGGVRTWYEVAVAWEQEQEAALCALDAAEKGVK